MGLVVFEGATCKLPSVVSPREGVDPVNLSVLTDILVPNAERGRLQIIAHYEVVGKVLNQLLREGFTIPEGLASPLLLYFLLGGKNALLNSTVTKAEMLQATIDLGMQGLDGPGFIEPTSSREHDCDVLWECVLEPRRSSLDAMKRGFDLVPISVPLLAFPWHELRARFTGQTIFTAADVLARIRAGWHESTRR
jgi:hypothetical protein